MLLTVLTDAMDLYRSRLAELTAAEGHYADRDAIAGYHRYLLGAGTDHLEELTDPGRRRVHNLKYITWVEQQGKPVEELNAQRDPAYWEAQQAAVAIVDRLIEGYRSETVRA